MPVKSTYISADGYVTGAAATPQKAYVIGLVIHCGATAGGFKLTDGSGAATALYVETPASPSQIVPLTWAPDAIVFNTCCYADVTNCRGTVLWK